MFMRGLLRTCLALALLTASLLWLSQVEGRPVHLRWHVKQAHAPITKMLKREARNFPEEPRQPENNRRGLSDVDLAGGRDNPLEAALVEDETLGRRGPRASRRVAG
ncbi:MAG: hypothetical protein V1806_13060 [Pseudomonadota bacterium]